MPRDRTILFVCTGNTCRSPMAEAIARDLLARRPIEEPVMKVASAGTGAVEGDHVTPEAIDAVEALGGKLTKRNATRLTPRMIAEADVIYVMTRAHVRGVTALESGAVRKVQLLDPDGEDVMDPLGTSQRVYTETARRLRDLIERRIKEQTL